MKYQVSKNNQNTKQIIDNALNEVREIYKSGKTVVIDVKDGKLSRSNQANSYAHKLIGLIAEHQGESLESIKKQIKHRIGLIEKEMINGELITAIRSTADLNKEEFSKFIEQIISVCQYLEIKYPIPDEYGFNL